MPLIDVHPGRKLTPGEIKLAKEVFGDKIDYDIVRVCHSPHLFSNTSFTPHGDIYLSSTDYQNDFSVGSVDADKKEIFFHEMEHVRQHQQGQSVVGSALKLYFENRGNYGSAYFLDGARDFGKMNIEQQASVVGQYYGQKARAEQQFKDIGGNLAETKVQYGVDFYERILREAGFPLEQPRIPTLSHAIDQSPPTAAPATRSKPRTVT